MAKPKRSRRRVRVAAVSFAVLHDFLVLKHYRSIPKHHYLIILPQIMARIDASNVFIRKTVHQVLHMLGQNYANALVYPLGVAAKDTSVLKKEAAQALLNSIRAVQPLLVEQAAASEYARR
jgi:phosphatidylinositol kinase/protein kinase (PI-3  family)